MRAWRFATRNFVRGLRAGWLTVLMTALTVAVAAITSIGFFIDRVRASVAQVLVGLSGVLATYSVVRQPPAGVLAQAS
jgi:putative ABC transport system permease protein